MKIPDKTYERIKDKLWGLADDLNWPTLSNPQKSALFEDWLRDDHVGGVLSRYLDTGSVRVYLKDTIMKPYGRERIKDFTPVAKLLGITDDFFVTETYIKPHGVRLGDGKVICWGFSRDWKTILFAAFERAHVVPLGVPFAAVIMFPAGKCQQPRYRQMIEAAAVKLGIKHLEWYDA